MVIGGLSACGGDGSGDDGGGPVASFCERAADAPDCDSSEQCEARFEQGRVTNPRCEDLYAEFAACLADLDIACVDGADFEIHAAGDGTMYDHFYTVLPIYLFYVRDTECRGIGDELQSCVVCADATGYPGGRGVGDRCSDSQPCADGLMCRFGMCTKACTSPDQCMGTTVDPFSCHNEFRRPNLCEENLCTSESHVDNDFCAAYGPGWEVGGFGLYCRHP